MSEPLPRGITLLDLVQAIPQGTQELIPTGIAKLLEHLSVVESRTRASTSFDLVEGVARSVVEVLGIDIGDGFTAEIPGVTVGIRFTYVSNRTPIGLNQNLEPAPLTWQISLHVDRIMVPMPGIPAQRGDASEGFVGPLVADENRERVHLWVGGVVLIGNASGSVRARLDANPDPFLPTAPSGAVLKAGLDPRHVLFGPSGFGMTVGEVIWDQTTAITPPAIVARGHDPAWRGISVSDATLYLPRDLPFVGDITAGVRDLMIGFAPDNGLQLEAFLQMGEVSRLDAEGEPHKVDLHIYQDVDGQLLELDPAAGPGVERDVPVSITAFGDPVRVMARLSPADAEARWRLPGGTTWISGNETPWLTVKPGDPKATLGYRDIFVLEDGDTADGPQITFVFTADDIGSSDTDKFPPKIAVHAEPFTWNDVVHISGTPEHLAGIWFEAMEPLPSSVDQSRFTWVLDHVGNVVTGTGERFEPVLTWRDGEYNVVLTDHLTRRRRLRVQVDSAATRVVIGCASIQLTDTETAPGPRVLVNEVDEAAVPTSVVGSYHLRTFHQGGDIQPADEPATLVHTDTPPLSVPAGTLAEVTLADPGDPDTHVPSAIRVLMEFDATDPIRYRIIAPDQVTTDQTDFEGDHVDPWGPADPYPVWEASGSSERAKDPLLGLAEGAHRDVAMAVTLRAWAAEILATDNSAQFVIIGRACDIGGEEYNADLGGRRAGHGLYLMTDLDLADGAVDPDIVYWRGENLDEAAANGTLPADPTDLGQLTDPDYTDRSLMARTAKQWRIVADHGERLAEWGERRDISEREETRGFDVYAAVPNPWLDHVSENDAATRRRTLVPGPDLWATITEPARERTVNFALRLLAKWDSPSWIDTRDSAPTLVEVALDWQNASLRIPELGDGEVDAEPTVDSDDPAVWQVVIRFSNDPRTRQMVVSGALDTPGNEDGILKLIDAPNNNGIASQVALTLALGPALATGVDAASADESVVPLAALLGVAVVASVFQVASNGVTTLHRLEFGYGRAAAGGDATAAHRIWLYADYTAGFDVDLEGLVTARGIEIRYRRAGIELGADVSPLDIDSVGIVYEGPPEIVAPGEWSISNDLSRLLGVVAVRMGAGSIWFEVDLALAVELGPVTLQQATLRLTLPGAFELRGLIVSVDVPGVLDGTGMLAITDDGDGNADVSAALDLAIQPIGLGIDAAFRYDAPMVHLEIGVTFATPIPLLGTGLGLFGLQGRFVSNGTRLLGNQDDPVQRELAWFEEALKYEPLPGQMAIGLGATVGTQPDGGFTFNINGMITVELPDPSVVLTVAGQFMALPEAAAEDAANSPTQAGLLGIVAISGDGIAVGIRGSYGVPSLLQVTVPVGAWFPFSGGPGGYVRIGADGFEGRAGDPVTITVLPGTLDLKAWAYLMIEEKELPNLGGKEDFDFAGYAIGFGCGYDFEWGGSAVYLRAGSSIVVGLGTNPLFIKGELDTGGELRFGPVGVSIEGLVDLTLTKEAAQLSGEFCGEVDLALIKAKGCVKITVGGATEPEIEAPPLVSGLSLTDRYARVVGSGLDLANGDTLTPEHQAWPDCRPTLHFNKRVLDALEGDSFQPAPSGGRGADWSGSARTKFLYRLRSVELLEGDENGTVVAEAPDWPSAWWLPAGRPAIPVEGDAPASEHEAWDLALLAWDLAPWARSMLDGGAASEGDPATVVERLCDPLPPTHPHCVYGADGSRIEPGRVRYSARSDAPLPWRSGAYLTGTETLGLDPDAAQVWGDLLGYRYVPSRVVPLPEAWAEPETGDEIDRIWLLPRYTHDTQEPVTLGLDATYSQDVDQPDLVVAITAQLPVDGSEFEVCYPFEEWGDGPAVDPVIDYGLVAITGQTRIAAEIPGSYQLEFEELVVEIGGSFGAVTYGPANRVEARVQYIGPEPIQMRALDAAGAVIAEANLPADVGPDVPYTLVINEPGIARVELWADPPPPGWAQRLVIDELCIQMNIHIDTSALVDSLIDTFNSAGTLLAPPCYGLRVADERQWQPTLLDVLADDRRVVAVIQYLPDPADSGPWNGVRLDPAMSLDVGIVRSCFTTTAAVDAAEATEEAQSDLLDEWNATWDRGEEERVVLLDADQQWTVRVTYDVAEWNQQGDAGPPAASSLDWDTPPTSVSVRKDVLQHLSFKTAPEASLPEADLLRFDVQQSFDPRALARYVVGFDPARALPRHFLDDKLLVHFEVEWIETLLAKYGYELSLDVVRTDPIPGSPTGFDKLKVPSSVLWSSNTSTMQASKADARASVAALLAPCVDGPQPQGVTACIVAELAALAEYDLIVRAVPKRPLGTVKVIARTHFSTSAYRDASELYTALGFDSAAGPNPIYAFEQIVGAPAPTDVLLADDVALDDALVTLGLDPLPLSDVPATMLLWIDDSGWKVAGLLLDTTEALERAPRLEDVLDDSPPGPPTISQAAVFSDTVYVALQQESTGAVVDYVEPPLRLQLPSAELASQALTPSRGNASATRVLLVPNAPIEPGQSALLELAWSDRGRRRVASIHVPAVPRLVSQESA